MQTDFVLESRCPFQLTLTTCTPGSINCNIKRLHKHTCSRPVESISSHQIIEFKQRKRSVLKQMTFEKEQLLYASFIFQTVKVIHQKTSMIAWLEAFDSYSELLVALGQTNLNVSHLIDCKFSVIFTYVLCLWPENLGICFMTQHDYRLP